MVAANRPMLDGKVEVDETYVGGRGHGLGIHRRGTKKEPIIGIRQRGGDLRFFHARDVTRGTLDQLIRENICENLRVFQGRLQSLSRADKTHGNESKTQTVRPRFKIYTDGDTHTNTVESAFSS
jgi:hypothetical protein